MTIMIVGSKGQVGSELVKESEKRGVSYQAFGRQDLDITNRSNVLDAALGCQPELIINATAYTQVDKAEDDSESAFAVNRDGVKYLAEAAKELGVPLIHISTDYVFDGTKKEAYVESDPTNPLNVYGASKLAGEKILAETMEKYLILRTSWVFGLQGGNFVKTMLRLGEQKQSLNIVSDQRGCPTYALDIARSILDMADCLFRDGHCKWGVYHYAGDSTVSWFDFAREVFSMANAEGLLKVVPELTPILAELYPVPAVRPVNSVLKCDEIIYRFGVTLSDWKAGVKEIVQNCLNGKISKR